MSTTNNNTTKNATRPSTFTKSQWDKSTYAAYIELISLVKGTVSISQFLADNTFLFGGCGIPADEAHVVSLLIAMSRDTTVDGGKVRKINPIGSLRQFFNRTWTEKDSLPVFYKDPTAPKESTPRVKKTKEESVVEWFGKMSKEEKAAIIARLMGEVAA